MGPLWVQWSFFTACLATGSYYALAIITRLSGRGEGTAPVPGIGYPLSHLAMAFGMAAMFSPIGDPVPRSVWLAIFGAAAAWFAAQTLRSSLRTDTTGHHLVANLAMLFMVLLPHRHDGSADVAADPGHATHSVAADPAHSGHAVAATTSGTPWFTEDPFGTMLLVALIAYFAVYAVRSVLVLAAVATPTGPGTCDLSGPGLANASSGSGSAVAPGTATGAVARRAPRQPHLDGLSHVVMGVAMAVMFGLML